MHGSRRNRWLLSVTILVLLATLALVGPAAAARPTPSGSPMVYSSTGYRSLDGEQSYTAFAENVTVVWNGYLKPADLVLRMRVCDTTFTVCTTTDLTTLPVSPSTKFPVNLYSPKLAYTAGTCNVYVNVVLQSGRGKVLAEPIPVGGEGTCLKLP